MTKRTYNALDKDNYVCSKKCDSQIFPFFSIKDKDFFRTNSTTIRFPCLKCNGDCHKKIERLKCEGCNKWVHRECSGLPSEVFHKFWSSASINVFRCSAKCELSLMPFSALDSNDFIKYVSFGKRDTSKKTSKTNLKRKTSQIDQTPTSDSLCKYIEPCEVGEVVIQECVNDLTIFHGNVCSLRKNIEKISETFQNGTKMPDILGVTETRVKDVTNDIELDGYVFEYTSPDGQAGGAGIYVANYLEYYLRDDLKLGIDRCEDVWIEIVSRKNNGHTKFKTIENLVVGMIYRHPGSQYSSFRDKLCSNIDKINQSKRKLVVMGDVNINSHKRGIVGSVTEYMNSIEGSGCLSFIDKSTRVVQRGETWETSCIDHMYSNIEPDRTQAYVITSAISDHFSTLVKIIDANAINVSKKTMYRRKKLLTEHEKEEFNKDLEFLLSRGEQDIFPINDVNRATQHIIKAYNILVNKHMPLELMSNNEKKSLIKPWITKGLQKSIKIRDKLRKNGMENRSGPSYSLYKKYRNMITHTKNISFNSYYIDKFSQIIGDKKREWEYVNEITNYKKRKKTEITILRDEEGNEHRDDNSISNCLNNYFNTIGETMATKSRNSNTTNNDTINKIDRVQDSIFLHNTTSEEILELIDKLKINKSPGIDGITNYVIKMTSHTAVNYLTNLFNTCMSKGIFPDDLKTANIIPIHKGGDKSNPTNYRPISLLPQFGKLFEKIIKKRFLRFLEVKNIITPQQFGFRKNYSTELAVTDIYNMLLKNMDEKKKTCTIFLDLAKAFDTVDHKLLLAKLERYGIRGKAWSLIKSYLENRKHLVSINGTKSSYLTLKIGVPQGSVLGPLLFLLFINDLPKNTNFHVKLFADDTFLALEASNAKELEIMVNREMKKVSNWLTSNKLTLNVSKTKFMLFSHDNEEIQNFKLKIGNENIEKCSFYKYLGIKIDDRLEWKIHVEYITEKIAKVCGLFSKLRHIIDFKLLTIIYHALVASHLQYCNLAWGNASETILKPLKTIQDRIIKIMTFAPFRCNDTRILYEDLEILNLEQIHKLAKGKFVYKYKTKQLPISFENYLRETPRRAGPTLRRNSTRDYEQIRGKTRHGLKMIQNDGIQVWNSIPHEIRNLPSVKTFLQQYKSYLMYGVI